MVPERGSQLRYPGEARRCTSPPTNELRSGSFSGAGSVAQHGNNAKRPLPANTCNPVEFGRFFGRKKSPATWQG